MLRRLFTLASALSLVLCVATCVLWVRTETAPQVDFFTVIAPGRSYGLGTEVGGIIGFLQREDPSYRDGDPADLWLDGAGFRFLRVTSGGMRRWNAVLPLWAVACAFGAGPAAWSLARGRSGRRARRGRCARCNYDLRATPGRCPECGTGAADGAVTGGPGAREE